VNNWLQLLQGLGIDPSQFFTNALQQHFASQGLPVPPEINNALRASTPAPTGSAMQGDLGNLLNSLGQAPTPGPPGSAIGAIPNVPSPVPPIPAMSAMSGSELGGGGASAYGGPPGSKAAGGAGA